MKKIFNTIGRVLSNRFNLFDTESFYDKHASDYEKKRASKGMLFNDYIEAPAVFEEIRSFKRAPRKVLDIGCGVGYYSRNLSYASDEVVALDISSKMIEIARKNCKDNIDDAQFKKISFAHSSFESYHAPSEKYFELVLATFMLSYFDNLDVFFGKVKNVIADNGKLITSMLHPFRLFSTKEEDGYRMHSSYFKSGYYESDFLNKDDTLRLKKWTLSDIANVASKNGFLIENLIEPQPILDIPDMLKEEAKFYYNYPSVLIITLRRK